MTQASHGAYKRPVMIRQVIKLGGSFAVTIPKKEFAFRDVQAGDWLKITVEVIR